jgi:cupin 2 domain-containing protein
MIRNLFADLPERAEQEALADLLNHSGVRIERIVSTGQSSPPGFWYDQAHGEWVAVLAGEARLRFEDEPAARTLLAGDFVDIAAHRRHRVEWTHPGGPTVWLAIHYD